MQLLVSGNDNAPIPFKHLWGRYITGFRPWKHCIGCFESRVAKAIQPQMQDGSYDLDEQYDLFYLCGVGQPDKKRDPSILLRRETNVHLAVRPLKGSVAAVGSVYGVLFSIRDAQAIPIRSLPNGFGNLPEKHHRCKNFQFGYQTFEVPEQGLKTMQEVIRTRRQQLQPKPQYS